MIINGKQLTPTQTQVVVALLREEALLGRIGQKTRAQRILDKIGEEV
jgi:hypothetical protein